MNVTDYIRDKGLKATPVRLKVLEILLDTRLAYTHTELECAFGKVDRITLYRVLKDFEEAGLVHKIIDRDGITRFAMCKDTCPHAAHSEDHVHFNCYKCRKMYCLETVHMPILNLPHGFKSEGVNMLILGLCDKCSGFLMAGNIT